MPAATAFVDLAIAEPSHQIMAQFIARNTVMMTRKYSSGFAAMDTGNASEVSPHSLAMDQQMMLINPAANWTGVPGCSMSPGLYPFIRPAPLNRYG